MTGQSDGALEGRLPILPDERLFDAAIPLLATCVVFGAAVWIFMVGAGLAAMGDIRFTIPGYMIGTTIGYVLVMAGAGLPSFRYGIDAIDAAKASFGTRGALAPLIALLLVALAWSAVATCFIAHGAVTVIQAEVNRPIADGTQSYWLSVVFALGIIVATWLLVRRGPHLMERINNVVGPMLLVMATILLIQLGQRVGWHHVWVAHRPAAGWMFPDRGLALTSAIELGLGASLGSWPFVAGFTRLIKHRAHVVTPSILGVPLIGGGYGVAVAALVANALPSPDPVMWFLDLGGVRLGGAMVMAVLLGNIAVIGLLVYFSAVAAQQIAWVRTLPWSMLSAAMLLPSLIGAFKADAVLSSVLGVCNYQSLLYVAITGVTLVNYVFVLRGRLCLRSIFARHGQGAYAGYHGWNIPAVVATLAGTAVYRLMYDPMTLTPGPGFTLMGASIPALLVTTLVFLGLRPLFHRPSPTGSVDLTM
jgi:nucleobase:cation symporter-1, NCS1 family